MVKKFLLVEHSEEIAPAKTTFFNTEEERRQYFIDELRNAYYKDAIDCLIAKHQFESKAPVDEKTFDFMRVHVASVKGFVDAINPTRDPERTFNLSDIKLIENQIKTQAFLDSLQAYLEVQQNQFYYNTQTDTIYTFVDFEL